MSCFKKRRAFFSCSAVLLFSSAALLCFALLCFALLCFALLVSRIQRNGVLLLCSKQTKFLFCFRKEMVLFFFCLFQEPLKEKKRKGLLVSRTASSFSKKRKEDQVLFQEKEETQRFCLFVSRRVCFKNKKKTRFCLFVSRKEGFVSKKKRRQGFVYSFQEKKGLFQEQEGLQNRSSSASFVSRTAQRKPGFVYLFQEKKALFQEQEGLLVSRTASCLFQEPRAACFKNRSSFLLPLLSKKWCCSSSACFKNRFFFFKEKKRRKNRCCFLQPEEEPGVVQEDN